MIYTVYKTTNIINNKIYIGVHQTENIDDGYIGSGIAFKQAVAIHGIDNFTKEILHTFDNIKDMFEMEETLVDEEFVKRTDTYNLVIGGKNKSGKNHPMYGRTRTEEAKRKMSEAGKGEHNSRYGVEVTKETKAKMSKARKGKPKSEAWKQKLSEAAKLRWQRQREATQSHKVL